MFRVAYGALMGIAIVGIFTNGGSGQEIAQAVCLVAAIFALKSHRETY
jgi:hypothetical protein